MKKLIGTFIALFLSTVMVSQTVVVSDTIVSSNLHGFTYTPNSSIYVDVFNTNCANCTEVQFNPSGATISFNLDTALNLTGYDSIKVSYKMFTSDMNSTWIVNNDTAIYSSTINPTWLSYSFISKDTINLNFNIKRTFHLGTQSTSLFLKNLVVIAFKDTTNTTFIKTITKLDFNVFAFENSIKVNGNISKKLNMKVFDLSGQVVLDTELKNEVLTNLPTGMYVISISDESHVLENKKVFITQ